MLIRSTNSAFQPYVKVPIPTYQIPLMMPTYTPFNFWQKLDVPNMERVNSSQVHNQQNQHYSNGQSKLEEMNNTEDSDCLKNDEKPHSIPIHHMSMPALPLSLKQTSSHFSSTNLDSQLSSCSVLSERDDCTSEYNDFTDESGLCYVSTNASAKPSPILLDQGYSSSSESQSTSGASLSLNRQLSSGSISTPKKTLCLSQRESSFTSSSLALNFDVKQLSLDFDDLNDCVAALLKKSKDENGSGRDIKRRQRKNKEQIKMLEVEFKKCNNWSRDYIKKIS